MDELTIVIDNWGHKELEEYLNSLKGILKVIIKNEKQLEINIKYDSNLITPKIIKMEILFFLDIFKVPSILSFDKHSKYLTSSYTITRDDICCEFCFKGAIDDLFEIEGIEKVESNFNEEYLFKKYEERKKIIINVYYNPKLISFDDMKKIELKLNI